eukprot:8658080-Karenia_brevis.AAC.1
MNRSRSRSPHYMSHTGVIKYLAPSRKYCYIACAEFAEDIYKKDDVGDLEDFEQGMLVGFDATRSERGTLQATSLTFVHTSVGSYIGQIK